MYSLTIHFGPSAMVWQFLFKEKIDGQKAYVAATGSDTVFHIEDSFGQQAFFKAEDSHGVLLEDLDLVEEAQIQRSLVNARAQAKLNSRAAQDPTLRAAQAMRGPAMIQPMGRG